MCLRAWLESLVVFLVMKDEKIVEYLKTHELGPFFFDLYCTRFQTHKSRGDHIKT